nr:MAG TPA: hypothetical protein [Caudoviricetes sp.]
MPIFYRITNPLLSCPFPCEFFFCLITPMQTASLMNNRSFILCFF